MQRKEKKEQLLPLAGEIGNRGPQWDDDVSDTMACRNFYTTLRRSRILLQQQLDTFCRMSYYGTELSKKIGQLIIKCTVWWK